MRQYPPTSGIDGERAVSPVIGVILMVAITVIMAAVIGTFVLGLGDQIGATQPTTNVDMSANGTGHLVLEHAGGDPVGWDDLRVVVGDDTDVSMSGVAAGDRFTIGDVVVSEGGFTGEQTVRLVHEPTNSYIADGTVDFGN